MIAGIQQFMAGMICISLVSGCALIKEDLAEKNIAQIESKSSDLFTFDSITATRQGLDVVIEGILRHRHGRTWRDIPGHVDVAVFDEDGETITFAAVPYRPAKPGSTAYMKFGMRVWIDDGSIIQLSHHNAAINDHF